MPTTNLSIGIDPVLDFECSGWPDEKREALSRSILTVHGVANVSGAGISTLRVWYRPEMINPSDLIVAVDHAADQILPGHNFSWR